MINPQVASFFYIWKVVSKLKEDGKKAKNQEEKTSKKNLFMHFYTESWNATNKSCLFDAKFFEFEEFSIDTFFCSSIQLQHVVSSQYFS